MLLFTFMTLFLCSAGAHTITITPPSVNDTDVDAHEGLDKRNPGGIYITTDINWGGTTGYATQPLDVCIQLDAPWYHSISSFGPDSGNAAVISENRDCSGAGGQTIFYPGYSNLGDIGWNDRIGSFIVRAVGPNECMYSKLPGASCTRCCHGCNRSGTDCCPQDQVC